MKKILQRTLMAYRPLYLNGLLLDGRYLPSTVDPASATRPPSRKRALLVALGGLGAIFLPNRNTPC